MSQSIGKSGAQTGVFAGISVWVATLSGLALVACSGTDLPRTPAAQSGESPEAADPAADSGGAPEAADSTAAAASGETPQTSPPPTAAATPLDPARPSYEVPVPAELADYAQYPIDSVKWRENNGERRLEYNLPADLVGDAQHIAFSGPASDTSSWVLRGAKFGTAECAQTAGEVVCHETLAGIAVDVAAVEARVNAGELDPRRLDVTRAFESDPIGILRFTVDAP